MKIEKISEEQVRIILSKRDLEERNIRFEEFDGGSEKTQLLFQDMMMQAHMECDFEIENTPLIVETVPIGTNYVIVFVTKVDADMLENGMCPYSNSYKSYMEDKYKLPERLDYLDYVRNDLYLYSFKDIDTVINACKRLERQNVGSSSLYKYQDEFFLLIEQDDFPNGNIYEMGSVLSEYGEKHAATSLTRSHLAEHGEVMIRLFAVQKLTWCI